MKLLFSKLLPETQVMVASYGNLYMLYAMLCTVVDMRVKILRAFCEASVFKAGSRDTGSDTAVCVSCVHDDACASGCMWIRVLIQATIKNQVNEPAQCCAYVISTISWCLVKEERRLLLILKISVFGTFHYPSTQLHRGAGSG